MPMAMGMGFGVGLGMGLTGNWQLATFMGVRKSGSVPRAYKCIHRI